MAQQMKLINEITPMTKQPWTVKAMVHYKCFPREPQSSAKKYQRLMIADSQGTRVQVTIFGRDIYLFENNLLPFKTYYISNATVKSIEQKHRIVDHPYQWIINSKTLVEEVPDDQCTADPLTSNFVSFSRLVDYKDNSTELVNVIAIALELLPVKERNTRTGPTKLQEMIIINDEFEPIILTMWNQFINNEAIALSEVIVKKPVIVGNRLKVVSYNGLSLSTRSSSSITIAPNISEAHKLQSWISSNIVQIETFMQSQAFKAFRVPTDAPSQEDLTYIESLSTLPDNRNFSLKCTISVVDLLQNFWYMSCSNCYKATSATYNQLFSCHSCRHKNVYGTPRCRVEVNATDSTGSITAILFGEDAERLLCCKALTLMHNFDQENSKQINSLIKTESDGELQLQVKAYHYNLQGESKRKFTLSFPDMIDLPQLESSMLQDYTTEQESTLTVTVQPAEIILDTPHLENSASQECTDEKKSSFSVELQAPATKTPIWHEGESSSGS